MTNRRKIRKRRNLLVKGRKILSMEEKSPTMPSVVFLKYLRITGEGGIVKANFLTPRVLRYKIETKMD